MTQGALDVFEWGDDRGVFSKPEYSPSIVERSSVIFHGAFIWRCDTLNPWSAAHPWAAIFDQSAIAETPQISWATLQGIFSRYHD